MASNSDRGEDKDLDTKDVQLAIFEEHFVEPSPSDANASTRPLRPAPKEASGNPEASAQGRVTSDPLSTAGARRLAFKRYGSAVSGGEDPFTEERHSEHNPPSAVGMGWVVVSNLSLICLLYWCLFAGVCVRVCDVCARVCDVCARVCVHACLHACVLCLCCVCVLMCVLCAFVQV